MTILSTTPAPADPGSPAHDAALLAAIRSEYDARGNTLTDAEWLAAAEEHLPADPTDDSEDDGVIRRSATRHLTETPWTRTAPPFGVGLPTFTASTRDRMFRVAPTGGGSYVLTVLTHGGGITRTETYRSAGDAMRAI